MSRELRPELLAEVTRPEAPSRRDIAHLAYTRKAGWLIVEWHTWHPYGSAHPPRSGWIVRRSQMHIEEREILAWAPLPPVPEVAA